MKYLFGVDEAGRGPLAGPVAVGVIAVTEGFDVAKEFPGVADSKKLSEKKREAIFSLLEKRATSGDVLFVVTFESANMIDREGIVPAIRHALGRGIHACEKLLSTNSEKFTKHVLLDGALQAPSVYSQETIIRGDESVPLISLSSVATKVLRDRHMIEQAVLYPEYGFEKHKGYGTRLHYEMLKKHNLCAIHRRSFIHLDFS